MGSIAQSIACREGEKTRAHETLTKTYQLFQKTDPMRGISRQYSPIDAEDTDCPPSEATRVQIRGQEMVDEVTAALTKLFDLTAVVEYSNCEARSDIVVDDVKILESVPVSYLLFLEKQLVGLRTFIEKLPTLDPSFRWEYDTNEGVYATAPVQSQRTKKVFKNHVKYEATKEHPAQVDVFTEDVPKGTWTTTHYSGMFPAERVKVLKKRVDGLAQAVKVAREQANSAPAVKVETGKAIFDFLFA